MQQKVNEYQFQNSSVSISGNLVQGTKIRWLTQLNLVVSSQKLGTEKVVNSKNRWVSTMQVLQTKHITGFSLKKKWQLVYLAESHIWTVLTQINRWSAFLIHFIQRWLILSYCVLKKCLDDFSECWLHIYHPKFAPLV